jgi:hypothetical protein
MNIVIQAPQEEVRGSTSLTLVFTVSIKILVAAPNLVLPPTLMAVTRIAMAMGRTLQVL